LSLVRVLLLVTVEILLFIIRILKKRSTLEDRKIEFALIRLQKPFLPLNKHVQPGSDTPGGMEVPPANELYLDDKQRLRYYYTEL
jgi:hypothetical protein